MCRGLQKTSLLCQAMFSQGTANGRALAVIAFLSQFYKYPDVAQFGRALALGARCRRFESCHPDHQKAIKKILPQKSSDFIRAFPVFIGKIFISGLCVQKRYFFQTRFEPSQYRYILGA